MRLLIWSDLQAHNWDRHSYIHEDGVNSRLSHCLSVITQVTNYARAHQVDRIVFCGDLVERIGEQETDVLARVHDRLAKMAARGIPVDLLPGNHDRAAEDLSSGFHVLSLFKKIPNLQVHDRLMMIEEGEVMLFFIPWQRTPQGFYDKLSSAQAMVQAAPEEASKVLFCHQAFQGGRMCDEGYSPSDEIALAPNAFQGFTAVFAGHLHRHERITRYGIPFWQVGAPLHHKKSDAEDPGRGFLEVTVDPGTKLISVTRVPVKAPQFRELVVADMEDLESLREYPGDFLYIKVSNPTIPRDLVTVLALKKRTGAQSVIVEGHKPALPETRLDIRVTDSREKWVTAYIEKEAPPHLNSKKLKHWMLRFMEGSPE